MNPLKDLAVTNKIISKYIIEKIREHSHVNHNNHKIPKSVKNTLKLEKGKTN
jgi:hypothetical protein